MTAPVSRATREAATPTPGGRLRRLYHLRRDLDRWDAAGRRGPQPQPDAAPLADEELNDPIPF